MDKIYEKLGSSPLKSKVEFVYGVLLVYSLPIIMLNISSNFGPCIVWNFYKICTFNFYACHKLVELLVVFKTLGHREALNFEPIIASLLLELGGRL